MSRATRSTWSFLNALAFTTVSVSVGVIATPWLLRWLGQERFGVYRVLTDWLGYIGLLELGIGGSLLARFAVAVGRKDDEMTRRLIAFGLRAYLSVSAAMLAAGLAWLLIVPRLISVKQVPIREVMSAAAILLFVALHIPSTVFRLLAEARQMGYLVIFLMTLQSLILTSLLLIAAWKGWGLVGQAGAFILAQLVIGMLLVWNGLRAYPGALSLKTSPEASKDVWSLNWPTFIFNLSGRIGLLSDNIVVASILGPMAVVPFFLTQRLAVITQAQLQSIGNASWAGMVELHAQQQHETFRIRFIELTGLVSGLAMALLGPIAAFNHHFVRLWVGQSSFAGTAITILVCVNVWLWSLSSLWGWPLSGTGKIKSWVPYAVGFGTINIVVSIVATFALGIVGPLLGTFVCLVLSTALGFPRVLRQSFGLASWSIWRAALVPLTWGIPYAMLLWMVARIYVPANWLELILEMAISGLGGISLWWALGLAGEDRQVWKLRFKGAFGR